MAEFGYRGKSEPVFVQCFDDAEVRRLKRELECPFKLVQLIGNNDPEEARTDYDEMRTTEGITRLAQTVDAIGPSILHLYDLYGVGDVPVPGDLTKRAHEAGLLVHPYTVRADALPAGFDSLAELVRFLVLEIGVDGFFTDFPDQALELDLSLEK